MTLNKFPAVIAAFAAFLFFSAAASFAAPPLDELLKKADDAFKAGQQDAAVAAWQAAVDSYPSNPRADIAYYRLANHHLENRNFGYAQAYYSVIVDQFTRSALKVDALIGLGASLTPLRRYSEAESALQTALAKASTPEQKAAGLYYLGGNHYQAGRAVKAVEALADCSKIGTSYREPAMKKIAEILHTVADEAALQSVADKYPKEYPAQIALAELVRVYSRKGDGLNLEKTKARLEADFPGSAVPVEAPAPPPPPPQVIAASALSVGVVLPLSGDMADAGQQALKGIQLAFSMKSAFVEKAKLKLVIKDAGAAPQAGAAALRELAEDDGVAGVVGLFSPASFAEAAAESRAAALPVLTAANPGAANLAPDQTRFIYPVSLPPAAQARFIGEYASRMMGQRTFAIIYPADGVGEEVRRAFSAAVEAAGGVVVESRSYQPGQTDFRAQLEGIGGLDDNAMRKLIFNYVQDHPERTVDSLNDGLRIMYRSSLAYPAITKVKSLPITKTNFSFVLRPSYEALFIAGGHEPVGLILPALSFFNIGGVKVLATDACLHPDFITVGGKYTEDVVFPGEYSSASTAASVKTFAETFEGALGGAPDATAARYYDAMMLLLGLIENGNASRSKVTAALDALPYYDGVSGGLYTGEGGGLTKVPSIFTIKNGAVTEVAPAAPPAQKW